MIKQFFSFVFSLSAIWLAIILIVSGPPSTWTWENINDQSGKVVICTGANTGIGFHFSRIMASKGATVIMACRDNKKCEEAAKLIKKEYPSAIVDTFHLDLAELSSVNNFVKLFTQKYKRLDILCNNAGIMGLKYNLTSDNLEQHIAVNHLSPFALTAKLYDLLLKTSKLPNPKTGTIELSRVISVSSLVERFSIIKDDVLNYDDLNWKKRYYDPQLAYTASKIANIQFMKEFNERLKGKDIISVGAHPGYSLTELQGKIEYEAFIRENFVAITKIFGQSSEMGAAPLVYAATSKEVTGGKYYGPGSFLGLWGWPKEAWLTPSNLDKKKTRRLWEVSEELTKVKFLS